MSWSLNALTVPAGSSIADAVNEQIEGQTTDQQKITHKADVQIDAAVEAAEALRAAVARDSDTVIVTMSGHYNKDFNPEPGWVDCMITISIRQIPVEPPKTAEA